MGEEGASQCYTRMASAQKVSTEVEAYLSPWRRTLTNGTISCGNINLYCTARKCWLIDQFWFSAL